MSTKEFIRKMLFAELISAPEVCQKAFDDHFWGAINPEWQFQKPNYEVLFQRDGIEYIAEFGLLGELIRYKMFLKKELLPALIMKKLQEDREIMNVVLINQGNQIIYEIIVRNASLKRFLIIVDQFGQILDERAL